MELEDDAWKEDSSEGRPLVRVPRGRNRQARPREGKVTGLAGVDGSQGEQDEGADDTKGRQTAEGPRSRAEDGVLCSWGRLGLWKVSYQGPGKNESGVSE